MAKSKIKVPKRVAGVKIPKAVRKGPVLQFVNSSAGKLLVAEALTAALGIFAYKQAADGTGEKIKMKAQDAQEALRNNTARLTHAFGEGVRAFREALSEPAPMANRVEDDVGDDEEAVQEAVIPAKKNPRRPAAVSQS